ncbi:MAG TPA: YggS family pyridoxal phosphate-dependent enzyme, partial [Phototrophicaceae bacterium]|nr:YggS family pyridoxal phosphate-dependent enzyme [Phototrophicaceae bacterium]
MTIAANVQNVRDVMAAACGRANRNPAGVTLIAVSKTQPVTAVLEAIAAGAQHLGENRVEESGTKIPLVNAQSPDPLTWHMIGHIQSRKAKEVADLFQMVQSVDSLKLAGKLSALAVEKQQVLKVLLEVNVSGEATKSGWQASGWQADGDIRRRFGDEVGANSGAAG